MEQPTEIYPELVLGDPDNPDLTTFIIGRQGDSAQLLMTVNTPNGAAVVAAFSPEAGLEVAMSIYVLIKSSDIVGMSPAVARIFESMMGDSTNDE